MDEAFAKKQAYATMEGIAKVAGLKKKATETKPVESKTIYRVQVGAFENKANAEAMQKKLKAAGYDAFIVTK